MLKVYSTNSFCSIWKTTRAKRLHNLITARLLHDQFCTTTVQKGVECVMFLLYVGVFYAFEIIMSVGIKAVSLSGATPIYSASSVQSSEL